MKTRTRIVAALALPVVLLAATACGHTGAEDTNTLHLLTNLPPTAPKSKALTKAIAAFEQANKGVKIKREDVAKPEDAHDNYERAKLAGTEPDIVFTNLFGKTTDWLKNGATVDVRPYAKDWGLESRLLPQALKAWQTSDGKLQGFPYEGFTWPMWYNRDQLAKAGINKVPTTTDELIADAKKLRGAGVPPIITGGKDWSGNKLFSVIVQSKVTDKQAIAAFREGAWDTPQIRAGIELFTKLRDAGVFVDNAAGLTVDQQRSSFGASKAAMMHAGSWDYAAKDVAAAQSANVELGGFPLPPDSPHDKPLIYTDYTATGIWISPNGQKKEKLLEKFVKFLYRPDVLGEFVAVDMTPPVPLDEVEVDKDKLSKLFVEAAEQLPGKSETTVLQDTYVPAKAQTGFERATSMAYTPGTSTDRIVAELKQAWR